MFIFYILLVNLQEKRCIKLGYFEGEEYDTVIKNIKKNVGPRICKVTGEPVSGLQPNLPKLLFLLRNLYSSLFSEGKALVSDSTLPTTRKFFTWTSWETYVIFHLHPYVMSSRYAYAVDKLVQREIFSNLPKLCFFVRIYFFRNTLHIANRVLYANVQQ